MKLFSNTITTLEHGLKYSATKQKVIAQNISNVDTPNYKAKEVNFKSQFQSALNKSLSANRTDYRHFEFKNSQQSNIVVTTDQSKSYNNNGNNVDVDKEMANLATNQIYYNALIDRINGKFQTLQSVIKGGR